MNIKELQQIEKQIDEFLTYEEDWDAEGALPLSKEVAEFAKNLLALFPDKLSPYPSLEWQYPTVSPLPNGGLGLEWLVKNRKLIMFINPDCQIEVYRVSEYRFSLGGIVGKNQALNMIEWVLR